MMFQHTLRASEGARKNRKRVGRGNSSGHGTFSGRGVKGLNARSGGGVRRGFEGGQTPMIRRMPKLRGFNCPNRQEFQVVNLTDLNRFDSNQSVTKQMLREAGLIGSLRQPVKLLGRGALERQGLTIEVDALSGTAQAALDQNSSRLAL